MYVAEETTDRLAPVQWRRNIPAWAVNIGLIRSLLDRPMSPTRSELQRTRRRSTPRLLVGAVLVTAVALFVSCGGEGPGSITEPPPQGTTTPPGGGTTTPVDTTPTPSAVTGITITPVVGTLTVSDTLTLAATLQTTGTPPTGGWTITWQSTDGAIVAVSTSGKLSAAAAGTAVVTASAGGKTASLALTVQAQPFVTSMAVSPVSATMIVGDRLTLTAAVGSTGPTPAGGWNVAWVSSAPSIATVSATGVVTAVASGTTTIRASAGQRFFDATITVVAGPSVTGIALAPTTLYLAPGEQGAFTAALTTIGTMPSGGWPIVWSSASPSIATVDASGKVTAVAPGSTIVSASSSGKTATATVAVSTASGGTTSVVSAVTISSAFKIYMLTAGTKALAVAVTADGPPPENGWPVVWTSSNPSVVTVSPTGTLTSALTAVAPGTATITATVNGVSATKSIEVLPPPGVIDFRIDYQDPIEIVQGDSLLVTVSHTLVGAIPPGGLITTWSTGNPAIATVSSDGLLKGVAVGTTTLTATSYDKTSTVNVAVYAPPPPPPPITGITDLSVAPSTLVLAPGGRGELQATVTATRPPTGGVFGSYDWAVEWTSSNPAVAVMPTYKSAYHDFNAAGEGTATITAAIGGKTATSTLYVATPTAVTISPKTASLEAGQQATFTSSATATGPLPPSGFPVGYASTSPLVATVSPSGVVTAVAAGKTRIFATAGLKQDTAIVTVSGPGLTLSLTGPTTLKGTITMSDGKYYLGCTFPMTMSATGTGSVIWGKEDWSINGGPFASYSARDPRTMLAGSSLVWTTYTGGPLMADASQLTTVTTVVRTHYAVNASYFDYVNRFADDQVLTTTYVCTP